MTAADPTQIKSSPDGYLQPPIEWAQLPDQVQQAILRLPPDNWQEAIDMFAFHLSTLKPSSSQATKPTQSNHN